MNGSRLRFLTLGFLIILGASGCNPISSDSFSDVNFHPGLSTAPTATPAGFGPFTQTYDLNSSNTASFSFNPQQISFGAQSASLQRSIASDGVGNGFSGGTPSGVFYDSTPGCQFLRLDLTTSANHNPAFDSSWTPQWSHTVGIYHLDETVGGSAPSLPSSAQGDFKNDSYLNSESLTSTGSPTFGSPGKLSNSITLNGGAYAYNSGTGISGNAAFTMMGWFKTTSTQPNASIVGWGATSSNNVAGMGYYTYASPQIGYLGYANDLNVPNITFADGNWHHLAVTHTDATGGSTRKIFLDGSLIASDSSVLNISAGNFNLGAWSQGDLKFIGSIDEVGIWNVSLSPSEVQSIYNRQSAAYAGVYTSRVMDAGASQTWKNFSWASTLPFYKPLPDNGVSESATDYVSLDATQTGGLMSNIAGLWHLNETSLNGSSTEVKDSSGGGHDGYAYGNNSNLSLKFPNPVDTGKFGRAVSFNINGNTEQGMALPLSTSPNPTVGDFSIAVWANPIQDLGYSNEILFLENYNVNGFRLGTKNGFWSMWTSESGGTIDCAGPAPVFNKWTHIAFSYKRSSSQLKLYVNGVPTICTGSFVAPSNHVMGVGTGNGQSFAGEIDEVAAWSRALNDTEVQQLYRRGANRIQYQIQTCSSAGVCSSAPSWQKSTDLQAPFFSELYNSISNLISNTAQATLPSLLFANFSGLSVTPNQFFQYQAFLESDDTQNDCDYGLGANSTWCSPELNSFSAGPLLATVTSSVGKPYTTLSGFIETLDTSGCSTGVVYVISNNSSNWYYWNGTTWATSNQSALQANQASVVNANIGSFPAAVGAGSFYFKALLQSVGTNVCTLKSVAVSGVK